MDLRGIRQRAERRARPAVGAPVATGMAARALRPKAVVGALLDPLVGRRLRQRANLFPVRGRTSVGARNPRHSEPPVRDRHTLHVQVDPEVPLVTIKPAVTESALLSASSRQDWPSRSSHRDKLGRARQGRALTFASGVRSGSCAVAFQVMAHRTGAGSTAAGDSGLSRVGGLSAGSARLVSTARSWRVDSGSGKGADEAIAWDR